MPRLLFIVRLYEVQRRRVNTVTHPRGLGAVIKQMAQMRAAIGAMNLGPHHEEASVRILIDVLADKWRPEAGPAATGIVLFTGAE